MKKFLAAVMFVVSLSGVLCAQVKDYSGFSYNGFSLEEVNARLNKNTLLPYPVGYLFSPSESKAVSQKALNIVKNAPNSFNAVFNYAVVASNDLADEGKTIMPQNVEIGITYFTKAIAMRPEVAESYVARADLRAYKAGLFEAPGYRNDQDLIADVNANAAVARQILKDYLKAQSLGYKGLDLHIAEIYTGFGDKANAKKHTLKYAEDSLERALDFVKKNPRSSSAYYDLAQAYILLGKPAESKAATSKMIELRNAEVAANQRKIQAELKKNSDKAQSDKVFKGNKGSNFSWLF